MEHKTMLERLPDGIPFPFNYQSGRIDRNALFVMNKHFGSGGVSAARTLYHRSHLTFDNLKADLLKYDAPRPSRHHGSSYYMVFESVRQDLKLYETPIVPLTTGAVANHESFPSSKSPGLPYKIEGYATKGDAVKDPRIMNEIRETWYHVEAGRPVNLPDVACYARAQLSKRPTDKIRATWGYPLTVYMAEAAYFYPILDVLKAHPNPNIAYGLEIGNGGMTFIHKMCEAFPSSPVLLGDWSQFDKTIPAWLIRDAFRIVSEAIDWTQVQDSEGKLWPVRGYRSRRRWRALVNYFIDTPIRLSNGERYIKHCGVPSGACFTNVIDSIVNMLVMRYLTYELTGSLPLADCYLGDDSVVVLPQKIDLELFSELALSEFGMIFNPTKSNQVMDRSIINFLGYFNDGGHPYKPLDTIIASAIYPERSVHTKFETITRLVGQAYCCFDPDEATKFLLAAQDLLDEEKLPRDMVDWYIQSNPHRFKYLQTIGIDPKKVTFPIPNELSPTWRTLPSMNRRTWSPKTYRLKLLYAEGLINYARLTNVELLHEEIEFD